MDWKAKWIIPQRDMGEVVPHFFRKIHIKKDVEYVKIYMTALGVYDLKINGEKVSEYVLAPGWTDYRYRLQYQEYDVTNYIVEDNQIEINIGTGWYRGRITQTEVMKEIHNRPPALLFQMEVFYKDGEKEMILSDENWKVSESNIRFSDYYDGEIFDANYLAEQEDVVTYSGPTDTLIPQEGEIIKEHECLYVQEIINTPKGEVVIDFGQEITGYVQVNLEEAKKGEQVRLSFGEVLDKNGNFYNKNYRAAKSQYIYMCTDGKQSYHPVLTFYGFRYVRIDDFPGGIDKAKKDNFKGIAVYSDIKQTGFIHTSKPLLNKLISNVMWGQKDNFLDIPTDCPQRDERLGWTGDAQVFIKTAAYNFNVERFFTKWLNDMMAEQSDDGYVGQMVPDIHEIPCSCAGWGDAATICPWELYMAYGNKELLSKHFMLMKKRVDYITKYTEEEYLWIGGEQLSDWLGLDTTGETYKGASRDEVVASAFYAYSTELVVKAGHVLGLDVSKYETLYRNIVKKYKETFYQFKTQTECVLTLYMRLTDEPQKVALQLVKMIDDAGGHLMTGFLGTPYLLHVLSEYGYTHKAYSLLLREEYPSWLYAIHKGATTVWEHWDSIKEDGTFWSTNMNSFNHYAYGAVLDWIYSVAAGIRPVEEAPGYEKVRIEPHPDERLGDLDCELRTKHGVIKSRWSKQNHFWRYEITTPVDAMIIINKHTYYVEKGTYYFYS